VHSQINKLNKFGLFCCSVRLSTSKFQFSPACWSAAEIPIHRGRSEAKIPMNRSWNAVRIPTQRGSSGWI